MVACSERVARGSECYYNRRQSVRCHECAGNRNRKCDGSFALEEFRKVRELKKSEQQKGRKTTLELSKLRKALIASRKALVEAQRALAAAEQRVADSEMEQVDWQEVLGAPS